MRLAFLSCSLGWRGWPLNACSSCLAYMGTPEHCCHSPALPAHPCSVRRKAVQQRNPTLYTMGPRLTSTKPPQHILDKVHAHPSPPHPTHPIPPHPIPPHTTPSLTTPLIPSHPIPPHTIPSHITSSSHLTPHHLTLSHPIPPHITSHHTTPFPFQIQDNKINIEIRTTPRHVKHYCVDSELPCDVM